MGETVKLSLNDNRMMRLKTNLSVWILYSTESFRLHMISELSRCTSLSFESLAMAHISPETFDKFASPDLIFVETGPNWAQKVVELQNYGSDSMQHQDLNTSLVVFGDETDNGALRIALRLGATDFVAQQSKLEDLLPLLQNSAEEKASARQLGQLFVFVNTKGGSGATTVVLNTAVEMARQQQGKVLLLDLDIHFGVVMDYLNLTPSYSINDAVDNADDLDEMSLQGLVSKHSSGLHILSYKHERHNENFEKALQIGQLVPALLAFYSYVFVDLSTGVDRMYTPVLSQANKVFLVTQQNLISIKNATRLHQALTMEYGVVKEQIHLLLNRFERRQQIKLKDVEQTMKGVEVHIVPNDFKAAIDSINLGKPVVESKRNSSISRAINQLCRTLAPEIVEKKCWLKRLFS